MAQASAQPGAVKSTYLQVSGLEVDGVLSFNTPNIVTPGATPVIDCGLGSFFKLTPGEAEAISAINMAPGQKVILLIVANGTTRTLTPAPANFKLSAATLVTGAVAGFFIMEFISDGTFLYEESRTGLLS